MELPTNKKSWRLSCEKKNKQTSGYSKSTCRRCRFWGNLLGKNQHPNYLFEVGLLTWTNDNILSRNWVGESKLGESLRSLPFNTTCPSGKTTRSPGTPQSPEDLECLGDTWQVMVIWGGDHEVYLTHNINGNGIFTYIWMILLVNVGKYTCHRSYGLVSLGSIGYIWELDKTQRDQRV